MNLDNIHNVVRLFSQPGIPSKMKVEYIYNF